VDTIPIAPTVCPFCHSPIEATDFFCPACGKNVREKPLSTSVWTQIGLYTVSTLLPPFFLPWTLKYLKANDPQTKKIGYISLGLIIFTLIFATWYTFIFTRNIATEVTKQLDGQVGQYQDLGL